MHGNGLSGVPTIDGGIAGRTPVSEPTQVRFEGEVVPIAGELQKIREFAGSDRARSLEKAGKELMTYHPPRFTPFHAGGTSKHHHRHGGLFFF